MIYTLHKAGGQAVGTSAEPIVVRNNLWRTASRIWHDPRPSDGSYVTEESDPAVVPKEVSMAQARIALSRAGISENAVDATINGMPPGQAKTEAKIWWNYSSTVRRTHPSVVALAPALGLTDSDLDALFTAAAAIDGS